uniref:Angiopoietin like 4 n=1 Tax=Tetraodon nigroviridis TaxID=99883 RepID=H3CXW4_TETNG
AEMKTPQLLVLLSSTLVGVSTAFPAHRSPDPDQDPDQDQYASWDEVNVVAHGLLQLGQGLKEHVDKTKAQTRDINTRLKLLDACCRTSLLQPHPACQGGSDPSWGGWCLQKVLAAQNSRIDPLVEKMEQQEDKLDKQSLRLQRLESKQNTASASTLPRQVSHRRAQRRRDGKPREEEPRSAGGHVCALLSGRARDCQHLYAAGQRASGVYTIQPDGSHPLDVFCDMTSEGGWTVIQRRHDGSQNFNQPWERYKRGFGSLSGEFWLGLEKIRSVSKQGPYQLRVELSNGAGQQLPVARYGFHLDGEDKKFALRLEDETASPPATAGGSGIPFSTADRDNDLAVDVNCAELLSGGWWFSSCGDWNLNGRRPSAPSREQPRKPEAFRTSQGRRRSVKTTLLKIAPTGTGV